MEGFVYRWTNITNGKWYIGSHGGSLDDGYIGSGIVFKQAIDKYGIQNFVREILYTGTNFQQEESRILHELNAATDKMSYNMKNDALGGATTEGRKRPNHGEWMKSNNPMHNPDTAAKLSEALKGRQFTDEWKDKLKAAKEGKGSDYLRQPKSNETKLKMREASINRPKTPCPYCSKLYTANGMALHHKSCKA